MTNKQHFFAHEMDLIGSSFEQGVVETISQTSVYSGLFVFARFFFSKSAMHIALSLIL